MTLPRWWHRDRALVAIGVFAVVVIAGATLAAPSAHPTALLDPQNPDPNGSQAVARVLGEHGVTTVVARGEKAFSRVLVDAGTTVMVTSAGQLGNATSRQLARHAATAGHVVLVTPEQATLTAFRLRVSTVSLPDPGSRCSISLLAGLRPSSSGGVGYRPRGTSASTCFDQGSGARSPGAIVEDGQVVVVGAFDVFANDNILKGDNAAIALRLLGQGSRLVWYVPDAADIPVGDGGSVGALLPGWLGPGILVVLGAVLSLLLWQGRRLGRVVVEPLPVAVQAAESARSRGRLYRRAHDRTHAAGVLRRGTTTRLTEALHLPRGTDTHTVARELAQRTRREPDEVLALLVASSVADDTALTVLANDLTRLEEEGGRP